MREQQLSIFLTESNSSTETSYLCSCPTILPTFALSHPAPDTAKELMIQIINFILHGVQPSHLPVTFSTIYVDKPFAGDIYIAECPHILQNYQTFGLSKEQAYQKLSQGLQTILFTLAKSPDRIKITPHNGGYLAKCENLLPSRKSYSPSKEGAFNGLAKTITSQLALDNYKKRCAAPTIITGSPHSGTSALALLLLKNGISMGTSFNWALDETDIHHGIPDTGPFHGIIDIIERYYPDGQHEVTENELLLLQDYFHRLLTSKVTQFPWGWKSPYACYIMPLLSQIFPHAKFIQIVRDGRDVALSPLPIFPNNNFGKLLYFDRTDIEEWEGIKLSPDLGKNVISGTFDPPPTIQECEFLAYLWEKISCRAAEYGANLGPERYLQIRFEELCKKPMETVQKISHFIGRSLDYQVVDWQKDRIGKYKNPPQWAAKNSFCKTLEKRCAKGLKYFGYID